MLDQTINHYRVLAPLGAGGMGEVYLAEDTRLGRQVALKFLPRHFSHDPEARARFEREAKALASLNHPNIVSVYDISDHDGSPFIVMEYVEGQTLKQLIASEDAPAGRVMDIVSQAAEGLAAAHRKNIIHRDIKSENIIVTPDGRVRIMDFGLATWRGATKVTKEGSTLGTIAYTSPEQAQGIAADQRSDLWSLGVVLYELLTRRLPFGGEHEAAITYSIVNDAPEPLARYKSDLPEDMQRIVDKALDKDPETRYQTAGDFLSDLRRLEQSTRSRPGTTVQRPDRGRRRSVVVIAPALFVFTVAILLLVLKPWRPGAGPAMEDVAPEDRVAVMYFENFQDAGDQARCGEILATLLISDLAESRYLQVVSSQRLHDLLRYLGKDDTRIITPDVATRIAQRARARWMITGSILETEPAWIVNAQLIEVQTGNVLASPTVTGTPSERVYTIVDRLTEGIRRSLSLPQAADQEADPHVAELTSPSVEAYRLFLEGQNLTWNWDYVAAERCFRDALAIDSTFAMAYCELAFVRFMQGEDMAGALEAINQAVAYADHASERDRLYILANHAGFYARFDEAIQRFDDLCARYPDDKEAYYWSANLRANYATPRDIPGAISRFLKAIEIDPLFKEVYNDLAYVYDRKGDFERSLWALDKYIALSPNEPNPYDSRAEICASNGRLEEALQSYLRALQVQPDFTPSIAGAASLNMVLERYQVADSLLQLLIADSNPDTRSMGRTARADLALHQGHFREALRRYQDAITAGARELGRDAKVIWNHEYRASVFEILDDFESAIAEIHTARELLMEFGPDNPHQMLLWRYDVLEAEMRAQAGDNSRADSLIEAVGSALARSPDVSPRIYWRGRADVAFNRAQFDTALVYYAKLAGDNPGWSDLVHMGRACHGERRYRDAVQYFEQALNRYDNTRLANVKSSVLLHYWLGLTYEKSGQQDDAVRQYERFLHLWRDADPVVTEISDARARLAELKQSA